MHPARAVELLSDKAPEIRARGVRGLSLFGSTARGEARPDSDVDILIDLDEDHDLSLIDLIRLQEYLTEILDAPADMAISRNIKPFLRDAILADAVRVF